MYCKLQYIKLAASMPIIRFGFASDSLIPPQGRSLATCYVRRASLADDQFCPVEGEIDPNTGSQINPPLRDALPDRLFGT
jgi:hypothetical protein